MYYILGALVTVILIWIIGSYAVVWSIEEPTYTVIENNPDYEIREYAAYIKAETVVTGDYNEATRQGFTIIADYIFGNNTAQENISMTTPVLEIPTTKSEKISMTTPVLETEANDSTRTIAFILPSKYTLETLPLPNNTAVKLKEVPKRKVAALTYTWYPTAKRSDAKKELLKSYLLRDGKVLAGEIETALYNPPLSMPLTLRNEILIPIE